MSNLGQNRKIDLQEAVSILGFGKIDLDDYYEIRDEYVARNMYLLKLWRNKIKNN